MGKRSLTQRSFLLGETREDFLEADDTTIRQQSCRVAENVRITAARTLNARPGLAYERSLTTARDLVEVRPATGQVFGLVVNDTTLDIIDATGAIVRTFAAPWTDGTDVWIEPFRDVTVIGGSWGLSTLTYTGTWVLADFAFSTAAGGELAQPYWAFYSDVNIQPSGITGNITVTASRAIWTPAYVGLRIRYGYREITITGYVSPTVLNGTVVSSLQPSYRLTMASTAAFRTGDVVLGKDTDYTGTIVAISGQTIDVATTAFVDGPDINEVLATPSGSSKVTAKSVIPPVFSGVWDEPLISDVRGYPRAGASAAGRLTFVDFPLVPDLVCMSSSRDVTDFKVGADDDDAISRQCGDSAPRFMHVVNAGDLILLSDRGLYYIDLRGGGILTPSNFNPILFDKRSSNEVKPAPVDDGVVFVEASGEAIAVAQLIGNVNLKWSVRTISTFHAHQIRTPVKICGPSLYSETPEKYLFVVNGDGTLATVSWFAEFDAEAVGMVPWSTQGDFISVSPIFGGYWAITERRVSGATVRFLERFDDETQVDCASVVSTGDTLTVNALPLTVNGLPFEVTTANQLPLAGEDVHVVANGWYLGEFPVAVDGTIAGSADFPDGAQAGFNFVSRVQPWPVEQIDAPHIGMVKTRVIRGSFSVLATGVIDIRANNTVKRKGGYAFGDDLDLPPPLETKVHKFWVRGLRDHPEIEAIKPLPGAFKILAASQEVAY